MTCSNCGQEGVPGAAFCEYCGTRLSDQPKASAPTTGQCATCQNVVGPNDRFCRACGSPVAAAHTMAQPLPASSASSRSRALRLSLAAALVIAIGAGAYFYVRSREDPARDKVIAGLLNIPLPPASYTDWRLTTKPYRTEGHDPEVGEIGEVQAYLNQGERTAGFSFTVFESATQTKQIFDDRTALGPQVGAEIARMQQRFTTGDGAPASCLGAAICHAAVGRVLVFVQMDRGTVDDGVRTIGVLAAHVSQLDR